MKVVLILLCLKFVSCFHYRLITDFCKMKHSSIVTVFSCSSKRGEFILLSLHQFIGHYQIFSGDVTLSKKMMESSLRTKIVKMTNSSEFSISSDLILRQKMAVIMDGNCDSSRYYIESVSNEVNRVYSVTVFSKFGDRVLVFF